MRGAGQTGWLLRPESADANPSACVGLGPSRRQGRASACPGQDQATVLGVSRTLMPDGLMQPLCSPAQQGPHGALNASGHMAQRAPCTVADMVLRAIYGGQFLVGEKRRERYSSACNPIVGRRLAVGLGETGRGPHCVVDLLHVSTKVSILEHHRDGSTDEQFG